MSRFNALAWAKAKSGGEQNPMLRRICEAMDYTVTDDTTNAELTEIADGCLNAWEFDNTTTEDVLGAFEIVTRSTDVTGPETVNQGTMRLKPSAGPIFMSTYSYTYSALDLSNLRSAYVKQFNAEMVGVAVVNNVGLNNSPPRLIMPEVWPRALDNKGNEISGSLMSYGGQCPAMIYLSKHFAEHTTMPTAFTTASNARYTEEIVVAPKDMDAQWHLQKFTKMTAETMVAILENLADVTDRADSYTLTLGTANLAKLTDAQKNIAIEKGWNLA